MWLHGLAQPLPGKSAVQNEFIFSNAGVVAVMYADWERDVEFASQFWLEVLNESNPDTDSASRELALDLRKLKSKEKKTQKDFRKLSVKASRDAQVTRALEQQNKLETPELGAA